MITTTLVCILGVLLIVVLMNLFKKQPAPAAAPAGPREDLANLKPSDARAGDSISISGAGDGMTDLDFTADRATWYEAGSHRWFEVSGPYRERRVAMRVHDEEEMEVAVHNDARKITLEDTGLSEEDLATMDERQNTADDFEYDNRMWMYRISREVQATRTGYPQPEGFYYWEFRQQDGPGILTIRKAASEPFAVTLYAVVPAGDVTVYRGGR
ncbi:MAG TPA: hypothetical protein VN736_03435 [Candidatus Limnocylindrales bacterium]|nr:hypothetical protein [Candidatus Limnocylindrales bacterium]